MTIYFPDRTPKPGSFAAFVTERVGDNWYVAKRPKPARCAGRPYITPKRYAELKEEWQAPKPATEPTEQGLQYVIEGCERRNDRKPGQLDLWS